MQSKNLATLGYFISISFFVACSSSNEKSLPDASSIIAGTTAKSATAGQSGVAAISGAGGALTVARGDASTASGAAGASGNDSKPEGAAGTAGTASINQSDAAVPQDASVDGATSHDASITDGGTTKASCCIAHAQGGCNDPQIEACVCAPDVLPDCCSEKWDQYCVQVVKQRYCESDMRDCVCLDWQQSDCCSVGWGDSICEMTAESKCGASPACEK